MGESRGRVKLSRLYWALITAVLVAFAVLVWPTPYRYDHFKRGVIEMPVRINRFTGRAECFVGHGPIDPLDRAWDSANGQRVSRWSSDCYR